MTRHWPFPLLRRELQLRAKRLLVSGIEQLGVDLTDVRLVQRTELERGLGLDLVEQLGAALPEDDRRFLSSHQAFGAHNPLFRSKLPFLLANGFTNCTTVAQLLQAPDAGGIAAQAAALFHLAAGVSDYLIDVGGQKAALEQWLAPARLRTLLHDRAAGAPFAAAAAALPPSELRLFLALIAGFVGLVHQLPWAPRARELLVRFTVDGYRSQLASSSSVPDSPAYLGICRTRVVAPSVTVAALAVHGRVQALDLACQLARRQGEIVGRVDDLMDLAEDLASGHVNLLLGAPCAGGPEETLQRLLDGRAVERCVERVLDLLEQVYTLAATAPASATVKEEFFQWLFTYLRGDLGVDDLPLDRTAPAALPRAA
jgi:hypothetical protein